jgi:hypothetical protein
MSFSSNIFTNLPLVHTQNPDFLGQQLWLCFSVGSWMSPRVTPEPGPRQIPESAFASSSVHACLRPWLPNWVSDRFPNQPPSEVRAIASSRFRASACSRLHVFTESWSPNFTHSRIRGFAGSRPPKIVSSLFLKNMPQELCQILTFRVWRVFLNSPTLAPRGSGLTPAIRFHKYFGNLVKKRHPRNVGGDTRRPETLKRLNRGRFRGTTPPRLYK